MTPRQASDLVGHSPQTRDIVERLRTYGHRPHRPCLDAADEIERLRTALRSVRALTVYTDSDWALRRINEISKDALRAEP